MGKNSVLLDMIYNLKVNTEHRIPNKRKQQVPASGND